MALEDLYTRGDLLQSVQDRCEPQGDRNLRLLRTACRDAYRDIPKCHDWKYLRRQFQFVTNAPYSTGSVEYTQATRTLTLTSGTWPAWAESGWVRISSVNHLVARRVDSTTLILDTDMNPGEDLAAGTSYQLFQQDYLIPLNSGTIHRVVNSANQRQLMPIDASASPTPFIGATSPGIVQWYTTVGASGLKNMGRRVMRLFPPPAAATVVTMSYDAHPRNWVLPSPFKMGTVSISSGGTTLTLTDAVWPTGIEGCLVRLCGDPGMLVEPTGPDGENPAAFASFVRSRTSDTVIELWTAADVAYSGVYFSLDDPLDIETSAMLPWLRAESFSRYLQFSASDDKQLGMAINDARAKLRQAREADSTITEPVDLWGLGDPLFNPYLSMIYPNVNL